MYQPSETLAAALAARNPQRVRLEFEDGTVFNSEDISGEAGIKLSHDFNSETDLTIGLCPSAELTFDLLNDEYQLEDFEFGAFTAWIGARIDSGTPGEEAKTDVYQEGGRVCLYEFAPIGSFIADRPDVVHKNVISVTAHDRMTLFDKTLPSDLTITYPITAANLLRAICEYMEVPVASYDFMNASLTLAKKPKDIADKTMRQIIGWIAEAACSNARFNRDGELELSWLVATNKTFTESDHSEFSQAWFASAAVNGLRIRYSTASSEYVTGGGDNEYLIQENPFLIPGQASTATAGTAIYQRLNSVAAYHPASAELFSDWTIEPGDIITVVSDETEYAVPVFDFSMDWKGDAMLSVQSTGNEKRAELPEWKRQRYGASRRASEEFVTYESLNAGTIEAINVGAGEISAGTLSAHTGNFSSVYVENSVHCADVYIGYGGEEESVEDALYDCVTEFGTPTASGGQISIPYTKWGGDTGTINFNIADTQYYQSGVSAAETDGWNKARAKVAFPNIAVSDLSSTFTVKVPSATEGQEETRTFEMVTGTPASSGYATVALIPAGGGSGNAVGRIDIGSWYREGYTQGTIDAGGSYQSGYSTGVTDAKTAVAAALGNAGWNSSLVNTQIYASLDTTNKRLTVSQAVANITYPGDTNPTAVSISIGNLDLTSALDAYASAKYTEGANSVTLSKGSWYGGGNIIIAASNMEATGVSLSGTVGSWDSSMHATVSIYDDFNGGHASTGCTVDVNGTSIYNQGRQDGWDAHAVTNINCVRMYLPTYDSTNKTVSAVHRLTAQGVDGEGETINFYVQDETITLDASAAWSAGYTVTQNQISFTARQPQSTQPTTGTQVFGSGISYSSYKQQFGNTIYVPFTITVHGTTKTYWFTLKA